MGFRDDELATRARVTALEQQLAALERENAALRSGVSAGATSSVVQRGQRAGWVGAVLALVLFGAAFVSAFVVSGYVGERVGVVLAGAAGLAVLFALAVAILTSLLVVVPPDGIVVLSGRRTRGPDGAERGYRVITGGRALRVPLIERVDELPGSLVWIEGAHDSVLVRRGRIDVRYRLGVRIARTEPTVTNAVERFLGTSRDDIARVARETFEGTLRAVAAELTADEATHDRLKLTHTLIAEAEPEYQRLGLELDSLTLLDVTEQPASR